MCLIVIYSVSEVSAQYNKEVQSALCFSWPVQFTHSGVTMDEVNATMITNTNIVVLFTILVCFHRFLH